jgi:hypothetical protein
MNLSAPILKTAGASNVTEAALPGSQIPFLPRYNVIRDPMVLDPSGKYARMAALLATLPTEYSGAGSGGSGGGYQGSQPSYGGSFSASFLPNIRQQTTPLPSPAQSTPVQPQLAPTTPWGQARRTDLKPWTKLPSYRR